MLPEDWKYQVAEIDGEWWINKVGTYGMASAQLYWGRMAALLLRILYYAFPWLDWGFVFVDDFLWLLRREEAPLQATAILLLLLAMGTPLSWKKTVLSLSNIWLGFEVDPKGPVITMARDKHLIIQDLLNRLVKGEVFSSKAIEKALGRLQWATSSCPMTRVFLQPFWAWKQACKTAGRPPKLVRVLAALLLRLHGLLSQFREGRDDVLRVEPSNLAFTHVHELCLQECVAPLLIEMGFRSPEHLGV